MNKRLEERKRPSAWIRVLAHRGERISWGLLWVSGVLLLGLGVAVYDGASSDYWAALAFFLGGLFLLAAWVVFFERRLRLEDLAEVMAEMQLVGDGRVSRPIKEVQGTECFGLMREMNSLAKSIENRCPLGEFSWLRQMPETFAHDVRTPLSAVIGYADLLKDEEGLSESNQEVAQAIVRSGERLLEELNELAEYGRLSRLVDGSGDERSSVAELVFKAYEAVEDVMECRGLELFVETIGPVPQEVMLNKETVLLILTSLFRNSTRWTRSGGLRVYIEFNREAGSETGELVFQIEDTGLPLSDEERSRLFQKEDGRRDFCTNATLSLDLCMRLSKRVGGDLADCSLAHGGSCLSLLLPAHRYGTEVIPNPISSGGLLRKTVMVVTCNPLCDALLSEYLLKFGMERVEKEGVLPDFIIWDKGSRGAKDEEARIRACLARRPDTSLLILMNGRSEEPWIESAEEPTILYKPLFKHELTTALNSLIKRS